MRRRSSSSTPRVPSLEVTNIGQMGSLKKILKDHPVIMVLVYADWCGHCQHFKPEWKSLTNLPSRNVPMISIRDDVFNASPLNNSLKVEGYPTVAVVNTKQNIAVNVPSREKSALSKLLSNASNLSSPPPPGTNLNNLNEELNIIREARNNNNSNNYNNSNNNSTNNTNKSKGKGKGKAKSFNNIMNSNMSEPMELNSLNENTESIGSIEPPEAESMNETALEINMNGGSRGLFDILNTYSGSKA